MSQRARVYRFKTAAQWQRCLATGFDMAKDGALQPIARLGLAPQQVTQTGRVERVAADARGPVWRLHAGGAVMLFRHNELGDVSRPLAIAETLAASPRWVVDHDSLWAFEASRARRFERDSLSDDLSVTQELAIRDLASDAHHGGAWLLLEATDGRWWLLHIDCDGHTRERHLVPRDAGSPQQLAVVRRGKRLVLLMRDRTIVLLDAATGAVERIVKRWSHGPCWHPDRLTSDLGNRMAILCHDPAKDTRWAVFVLDAEGDTLDLVAGPPPPRHPEQRLHDVAISGGTLWLAADDGLWRLDAREASVARESESLLLTPMLFSPQTGAGGGWLRAEISLDLPRGAVIEAEAVTTDDVRVAQQAQRIASDTERTAGDRQRAIWDLFDHDHNRVFVLTAAAGRGESLSVPLFASTDRWLWLRLKIVTPPGVTPAALRELHVLYPDASIAQYLPSIYRGGENDPTGALRSIVGVLETTTQSIDARIRGIASYIDPGTAPGPALDYMAGWLDLPWEDALPLDVKRRVVRQAGVLLEQRGTRRGLQVLLDALIGRPGRARVVDLTVDHPPVRIGGPGCGSGPRLPLLLAGPAPNAPVLNAGTVLGRACLGVPCDPLGSISPALRISIVAPHAVQRTLEPLVARILTQYVPAGIKVSVSWTVMSPLAASLDAGDDDVLVLDGNSPGRLGEDSEIGRVVISRRGAAAVDSAGLDVGFRLS
jgi:phage tail-like protein